MLNLFIKSGIIHHRESCFSSIFNVIQIIQDSSISEKEKNVLLNDFLLNCKLNTRLHRKKMCVRCMVQLEMFRSLWFRKSPDLPFPQPKINTNLSPKVKCWVMGEVGGDSPSPQFISKSLLFSYVLFQSLGIQPELSENSQKLLKANETGLPANSAIWQQRQVQMTALYMRYVPHLLTVVVRIVMTISIILHHLVSRVKSD